MNANVDIKFVAKLHIVKYITVRYLQSFHKVKFIKRFININEKSLLDFGGGSGAFCGYLKENFPSVSVHIYDPSTDSLSRAKSLFNFKDHELFSEVNQINQNFDILTSFFVYAYVPDKVKFWNDLSGFLKINGLLFVEVDNRDGIYFKLTKNKKRPIENWNIDLKIITDDLYFLGSYNSPWSNHMSEIYFKGGIIYKLFKYILRFTEILFNQTESRIYIFRKVK